MSSRTRAGLVAAIVFGTLGASEPVVAHGIGGRTDLPLPAWQLAWAAGFAVASSFVALGAFWATPRLVAAADGRELFDLRITGGRVLLGACRAVGLALFAVVLYAAWFGNVNGAVNVAPEALLIWFWVGLQMVSFLLGDLWRAFNPYLTIISIVEKFGGLPAADDSGSAQPSTLWPAVVAVGAYLWYELAYHSPSNPRSIAVFLTLYSTAMVCGGIIRGRAWLLGADGFAVLFNKLSAIAPLHVDDNGRLRRRVPLAGLATLPPTPGTVPFVLVVLGSTTFDGFTRSSLWLDLAGNSTGWSATVTSTVGLLVVIGLVSLVYMFAMSAVASVTGEEPATVSRVFGPTLVPIAAAYAVAHYFSLLILDGQRMFIRISDPFGRGWDLFGTADYSIDWTVVSPGTIAWIQTLAIAVGHVLAVAAAHDVAISRYEHRHAVRSQYPMLVVMIVYTVLGLFLLLGA